MHFEESIINSAFVVKIRESRITADIAPQFKESLIKYIQGGNRLIILDLREVLFIDSSGLGALIGSLKAMGGDGKLALCGAREAVVNMFKLTRMDKVFHIFATPDEAASALSSLNGVPDETSHARD